MGHHGARQPLRPRPDNVVYHYTRRRIVTEDGAESFNLFDHNFSLRSEGRATPRRAAATAVARRPGAEGAGFWFRGPNNYIRNNVAAMPTRSASELPPDRSASLPLRRSREPTPAMPRETVALDPAAPRPGFQ